MISPYFPAPASPLYTPENLINRLFLPLLLDLTIDSQASWQYFRARVAQVGLAVLHLIQSLPSNATKPPGRMYTARRHYWTRLKKPSFERPIRQSLVCVEQRAMAKLLFVVIR